MAQDINVPVVTPNPIQFQPPTDLVNSYLNRKQANNQDTLNRVSALGATLNAYKQQRIQNQLKALAAYSSMAGTSGITAANQMAPNIPGMANTQNLPQDPFNTSYSPPAGGVGGGSGNAGGQGANPQGMPQSNPNPSPNAGQTVPSASSQGSPQTLGGNPPQAQPSPYIAASLAAGHPDNTGYSQRIQPIMDQMSANSDQIQRSAGIGGTFAQDRSRKFGEANAALGNQLGAIKSANDISMQPAQAAKLQNDVDMLPTQNAKAQQDLSNAQQQVPVEIGGKSAEVQKDYGAQDVKIQQGMKSLQDLRDAWAAVPAKYKGPMVGQLTSSAGSGSSGIAPEIVRFNNAHANAATALATALLPENARANPLMVEEVRGTIPTLAYGQKAFDDGIGGFEEQLKNNSNLNYQNHESQAKAFGGSIAQNQTPDLRVMVKDPKGRIGHIPSSQLKAALAQGYTEQ